MNWRIFAASVIFLLVSCGGDSSDGAASLSLAKRQSISAGSVPLSISKTGTGAGTVTSGDGSINCGATCAGTADPATLSATPAFGSLFAGWSGACSGLGACVITGDSAQGVTANFVTATTTLQMPWFTKVPGYISRFVLLNSGASDATYNVVVGTEPGNTAIVRPAYTSGTIRAGTQLVLNVDDIVESFSVGQRGFAFIATNAPTSTVSGIYNLVQPSTGAISNVSLLTSSDVASVTTLVAPWITVDEAYRGDLILTNQGALQATATLTYLPPSGGSVTPKTSVIPIPARGQVLVDGASLATPSGGASFGAVLMVNAPPSQIKGTYKIFRKSTGAASSTELTEPANPTASTILTVPWFSTAPGYESRFILTNRSGSPVSYTMTVLPETGNTITTGTLTGSIPANGQAIIPASSVLLSTTTATRASATFQITASAHLVDGIYQIVGSGTGAISNTVMVRQASSESGASALLLPWFSTASGYISRIALVNTSSAAAPYTIHLAVEQGNYATQLLATSGTIPARSLAVIPMSDVVAGFTGNTRASAIVRVQAAPSSVQGLYNIVNPVSGTISNTSMVHAPAEITANPPLPLQVSVASVTVSAPTLNPKEGDSVQLTAVVRDSFGNIVPGVWATWSVSDPALAAVSAAGLLQTYATGTVQATATVAGVTGNASLTISAIKVAVTTGTKEVVYRYATERCSDADTPDQPPRMVRAEEGGLVLFAGNAPRAYVSRGPDFGSLKRDCSRSVLVSADRTTPESYENQEWIWVVYREGNRWHGLISNEYHDVSASTCLVGDSGPANPCWYNSITHAVSIDSARSFSKPSAPAHVVAPAPNAWVPPAPGTLPSDVFPQGKFAEGYFPPSNIVRGSDGLFYTILHAIPSKLQPSVQGLCTIRTDSLDDPARWRAWDGNGYNVRMTSPYVTGSPAPMCTFLKDIGPGNASLTYNSYLGRYMRFGNNGPGTGPCGFYFTLSADLVHWSGWQLAVDANMYGCGSASTAPLEPVNVLFPAIVDHSDATANFERAGQNAFLYYVRFNRKVDDPLYWLDRDLVRVPITFTRIE